MKTNVDFVEEHCHERLLDSTASSSGSDSPSRSSRSSLIRIRSEDHYNCHKWLPLTLAIIFIFVLVIFILLLMLAFAKVKQDYTFCQTEGENPYDIRIMENNERLSDLSERLSSSFDSARIRRNLRWLSRDAHVAGSPENAALMRRIADEYGRLGFNVKIYNYSVLLNYPDYQRPNTVEVRDEQDEWWTVSLGRGRTLGPKEAEREQSDPRSTIWWNAYSANGTVSGLLLYCNYGMKDDFMQLKQWGHDVRGKIALIRYGGVGRAEKVKEAENAGAVGVILFSDPIHYTNMEPNGTFPNDVYLPGYDAQRGSAMSTHGDPLSPLFPSLPYVHRTDSASSAMAKGYLPRIPVTPVGYDDARRMMDSLDGQSVLSSNWRGGLGTTYRLSGSRLFRLSVRSRNVRRTISNVVATIKGREEPDRWVIVGNHVDAWGNGAIDPLSGTATQLEMARVAAKNFLLDPPRRSIVFCHWDAEEFGLIGSTEWIEEMQLGLDKRAVAYINVDHIAGNSTLDVKSVPLLYRTITDAAERTPQLNMAEIRAGRSSLLDSWKHFRVKGPISGDRAVPDIGVPAGGSDYQRFISFSGIPSADLKMESWPGQSYALYHTMYETFWTVNNLIDPDYTAMLSVGRLWIEITHRLANHIVIPFHTPHLSQSLTALFHKAETQMRHMNLSNTLDHYQDKVDSVRDSLRRLHHACGALQLEIQNIETADASVSVGRLEQINSRLQYLERAFVDPFAFTNSLYRHILFSPSRHPSQVTSLSNILDPAIDFYNTNNSSYLEELNISFTRLQYSIESAILLLSD